jgi:hypothetical protein
MKLCLCVSSSPAFGTDRTRAFDPVGAARQAHGVVPLSPSWLRSETGGVRLLVSAGLGVAGQVGNVLRLQHPSPSLPTPSEAFDWSDRGSPEDGPAGGTSAVTAGSDLGSCAPSSCT